jgi:hypothetical protein
MILKNKIARSYTGGGSGLGKCNFPCYIAKQGAVCSYNTISIKEQAGEHRLLV